MIAAVFIAAVLDANLRAKTFWRMGVLVPYVVAPVAVGLIFNQMFADQSGFVNAVLTSVGLPAIGWHADSLAAHFAIATMVNFRWTGYNALIVLAAMQAIPATSSRPPSSTGPPASARSSRSPCRCCGPR